MKQYETKILTKDDTTAFLDNMRWFAGYGKIIARKVKTGPNKGLYLVRASKSAWSNFII